ncbi:MAG: hypothetical protein JNM43_05645 [Planctomycetaceae bacterium]|nr:hypothetical protein [Planctomycetaceae bacterium]
MSQLRGRIQLAAIVGVITLANSLQAQVVRAPLNEGFARTSSISMSVDEMLGTRKARALTEPLLGPGYPSLWISEVQFKPLRLMKLTWTDDSGEKKSEIVRYMVYRVIRRDYTELAGAEKAELERKLVDPDNDPSNVLDPESSKPLQMPRFILRAENKDGSIVHEWQDEISIAIQNAVFERELGRKADGKKLLNSIEAVKEVEEPVASSDPDVLGKALYGVAVWRNVDDSADFFSVQMSGFTNAYRMIRAEDGSNQLQEKVIVQRFARPGDQFLQDEMEFRFIDDGTVNISDLQIQPDLVANADPDGDGKVRVRYPTWIYVPRKVQVDVPGADTVLRNLRSSDAGDAENR